MTEQAISTPVCVLVTGFEPFAGSTLNPSQVLAEALSADVGVAMGGVLHTALLPVDVDRVAGRLSALWSELEPDVVLHFGESAKAEHLTLERVAVNLLDFDRPDNAGRWVVDTPIDPAGPTARFVTLPVRAMMDQLKQAGVESRQSLSAGAYLCNQVFYLSLGHGDRLGGRSVGFVHVPSLPEQVRRGERQGPAMPREQLIDAAKHLIRIAIRSHRPSPTEPGRQVCIDPGSQLR